MDLFFFSLFNRPGGKSQQHYEHQSFDARNLSRYYETPFWCTHGNTMLSRRILFIFRNLYSYNFVNIVDFFTVWTSHIFWNGAATAKQPQIVMFAKTLENDVTETVTTRLLCKIAGLRHFEKDIKSLQFFLFAFLSFLFMVTYILISKVFFLLEFITNESLLKKVKAFLKN